MATVVPATIGKVDSTNKGQSLVDNDKFLVMGPKIDASLNVVRMTEDLERERREGGREGGIKGREGWREGRRKGRRKGESKGGREGEGGREGGRE